MLAVGADAVVAVVDGDLAGADDFKGIAGDNDGGAFVDADAEQFGLQGDDGDEVVFAVAGDEVLVDGDVAEEAEALFVAFGHHDGVALAGAADEVAALDGRSGAGAGDDATAGEEVVELLLGIGAEVAIDEAPLAAAVDEDALGLAKGSEKGIGVGFGTVFGVKLDDVREAVADERVAGERGYAFAGRGNDDDGRIEAAGERGEAAEDFGAEGAAADDHQVAFGGSGAGAVDGGVGDGLGPEKSAEQEQAKQTHSAIITSMFSSRLPWSTPSNALSARAAALRGQYLDLTETNPTRAGLAYPEREILAAFARPEMLTYEPDPCGLPAAREAVNADFLTASTSESYSWLFKLLCDPGDEILVPRPSYPLFEFLAGLEGVRVKQYPLRYAEGWFVDFAALEQELSPRTKAILAVHPNNPTGSFLHAFELERLTSYGLPLISDEVFASYAHVDGVLPTLGENGRVLTFVLDGLSKSAGMPQMKAGWIRVSGPGAAEARERLELIADTYLSVSTPVQWALPALLRAGVQSQILERVRGNLARVPGALRVEGGWCAILRMPAHRTDEEWAGYLLEEKRVLTQPGYFFDLEGGPYLVVSLLTEPGTFAEGLRRITA